MSRVLGIDPGLRLTGYGLVDGRGSATGPMLTEPVVVEAGVIRLDAKLDVADRLRHLHEDLTGLIEELQPTCVAVEKLYAHYKHPRTAILMAHARGVILLAAKQAGLEVVNLPSTAVKKAVTGNGHASKLQVQRSIQSQFGLAELPDPPDIADALAIALTHARRITLGCAV